MTGFYWGKPVIWIIAAVCLMLGIWDVRSRQAPREVQIEGPLIPIYEQRRLKLDQWRKEHPWRRAIS